MQFLYHNKSVQKIMENPKLLQGKVGLEFAKSIIRKMNHLAISDNFYYYLTKIKFGNPHSLSGDMKGCYALSISPNYRLIVKPNSNAKNIESLKNKKEIFIEGVVEYHDGKYEWIIP